MSNARKVIVMGSNVVEGRMTDVCSGNQWLTVAFCTAHRLNVERLGALETGQLSARHVLNSRPNLFFSY